MIATAPTILNLYQVEQWNYAVHCWQPVRKVLAPNELIALGRISAQLQQQMQNRLPTPILRAVIT